MKIKGYDYFKQSGLLIPSDLLKPPNTVFADKFGRKFTCHPPGQFSNLSGFRVSDLNIKKSLANLSSIVLETTEDCNLSCRYCFYSKNYVDQRKKTKKEMSIDTASSSLNFFFDWIIDNYSLRKDPMSFEIAFYGGEPTLNFKLINYVNSWGQARVFLELSMKPSIDASCRRKGRFIPSIHQTTDATIDASMLAILHSHF